MVYSEEFDVVDLAVLSDEDLDDVVGGATTPLVCCEACL